MNTPRLFSAPPRRPARLAAILALTTALTGCGEDSPTDVDETPQPLPAITVDPASARPGQAVTLGGPLVDSLLAAEVDLAAEGITLEIGGFLAPVRRMPGTGVVAAVPVVAAGADGQSPPTDPQDVVLVQAGTPLAEGTAILGIDPLESAPGSSVDLTTELNALAGELSRVAGLTGEPGSAEYGYAQSALDALLELTSGTGEESLASLIADAPEEDLAFVDALVASTGIVERTRELVELYGGLGALAEAELTEGSPATRRSVVRGVGGGATALAPPVARDYTPPAGAEVITDLTLARKMQFQVVLEQFSQTVINETASEWGLAGTGFGGLGLIVGNIPQELRPRGLPLAGYVSAVLGIADFVANKILVGLNPSEVTGLVLDVREPRLDFNTQTTVQLWVEARNTPPEVGVQDMVGITLTLLGLVPQADQIARNFEDVLEEVAIYFINTIQGGLSAYASAHPEANMDVTFQAIPRWTWAALVTDRRFVDLVTFTPELLTPLDNEVNWESGDEPGEARIGARIATGPNTHVIAPPIGFSYNGGAFGESVVQSETESVFIDGPLGLAIVSAPETLEQGEIGTLIVEAGVARPDDTVAPREGVEIEIVVDGGVVETATGTTDADGLFTTSVQLSPGSDGMILSVTARNEANEFLTQSVEIREPAAGPVRLLENRNRLESEASAFIYTGPPSIDVEDVQADTAGIDDFTSGVFSTTAAAEASTEAYYLASSAGGSLDWSYEQSGSGWVIAGSHVSTASAEASSPQGYSPGENDTSGDNDAVLETVFQVLEETSYRIVVNLTGDDDVRVRLYMDENRILDLDVGEENPNSLDLPGTLAPGIYRLEIEGGASTGFGQYRDGTNEDGQTFTARVELGLS